VVQVYKPFAVNEHALTEDDTLLVYSSEKMRLQLRHSFGMNDSAGLVLVLLTISKSVQTNKYITTSSSTTTSPTLFPHINRKPQNQPTALQ
jgi:hypothetical protein